MAAPVYTFDQKLSADGQFMESTLSYRDQRYVLTATEFGLQPAETISLVNQIGKLDGQQVYRLPDNNDYVLVSGFMMPAQIFRRESAPAIDYGKLPVREIQYFGDQAGAVAAGGTVKKTSSDPTLIQEICAALKSLQRAEGTITLPGPGSQTGQLWIFSDSLKQLYDYVVVSKYPDGKVYFSFPAYSTQGVEAGERFEEWVR